MNPGSHSRIAAFPHRTPHSRPRAGATLVELLFAAAVLAALLLGTWTLNYSGFTWSADLARRETAESLSRNLLDRFGRLPLDNLDRLFGLATELDVDALDDLTLAVSDPRERAKLRAEGFERKLEYTPIGEGKRAALLRTRVSWRLPGGVRRSLSHSRYVVSPEAMPDGLAQAPGFSEVASRQSWGRRETWARATSGELDGVSRASDKGGAAAALTPGGVPALPAGGPAPVDAAGFGIASDLQLRKARLPIPDRSPGERAPDPGTEGWLARQEEPIAFAGRPETVARLLGPQGLMGGRYGDPAARRAARAARAERRFLARTGVETRSWIQDEIPDGIYLYRLEVLDLRTPEGDGTVTGVFQLKGEPGEYRLVEQDQYASRELATRKLAGEVVLESRRLADQDGRGDDRQAALHRTESRIYVVRSTPDPLERKLAIRALPLPDGSKDGTTATRKLQAELLRELAFAPVDGSAPDPVRDAAGADGAIAAADEPEDPCARTACVKETSRMAVRMEVPKGPAPAAPGAARIAGLAPGKKPSLTDPSDAAILEDARRLAGTDPGAAALLLERYLRSRPGDAEARALRGRVLAVLRRHREAIRELEMAADAKADPLVHADLAGVLLLERRPDEAEAILRRANDLGIQDPRLATLEGAVDDLREFLAAPGDPVGDGAAAPAPPPPEGTAVVAPEPGGAFMAWSTGDQTGSVSFSPPRR